MNAEEVAKELESRFVSMQLNHLKEISAMKRRYESEKERLETSHRNEMARLHGQELELTSEINRYNATQRQEKRKFDREIGEMKERNRKEEASLRDENNKLYKEDVQERSRNAHEVQSEVSRAFGSLVQTQADLYGQEDVQNFQRELLEVSEKWNEVKGFYANELKRNIVANGDKDDVLSLIGNLKSLKKTFNTQLRNVRGSLGGIKHRINGDGFRSLDKKLELLQRCNFEDVEIPQVKRALSDPVKLEQLDSALQNCDDQVSKLFQTPLSIQSSSDNLKVLSS